MSDAPGVELSVVLLAPDGLEGIRRTLGHIRTQTVQDRLEIVIVAPTAAGLEVDSAAAQGFGAVQIVEGVPSGPTEKRAPVGCLRPARR